MSEEFKNFLTQQEALKSIERLKNIKWPEFENFQNIDDYIKEIENIIYNEFKIIPNVFQFFEAESFNLSIFRARELNTISNIDLISNHSYPPPNFTGFGRCNFPQNPVFYCSDNPITCLLEIIRDTDYRDREFCLTKWEVVQSKTPIAVQPFFHKDLPKENGFSVIKDLEEKKLDETFDFKIDSDKKAGLLTLLDYLRTTFINDSSHKISAAIVYNFFYAKHNYRTDILMYPSIYTGLTGMNMAMNANFVDNQLQLKRLYNLKITNINIEKRTYNLSFGNFANVEKNVMMWKDFVKDNATFKKYFDEDLKDYINPQ